MLTNDNLDSFVGVRELLQAGKEWGKVVDVYFGHLLKTLTKVMMLLVDWWIYSTLKELQIGIKFKTMVEPL